MIVEQYSDKYFLDVVRLIENFHEEAVGEYDNLIDSKAVIESIKAQAGTGTFLMVVNETCQGILHGVFTKSPLNDRLVFQEVMWYVNGPFRGHGVKLLKEVENRLKLAGVGIMIMAVLENSKTEKLKDLYVKLGYKKMETHYIRSL